MKMTNKCFFLVCGGFLIACDTTFNDCNESNWTTHGEDDGWNENSGTGGELFICYSGEAAQDVETTVIGTITALNDATFDCSQSVTVIDEDGALFTFGYTMIDEYGDDLTPDVDLRLQQQITVDFLQFVDPDIEQSLIVNDKDGLVLAANRGFGDTPLHFDELPFTVTKSAKNHLKIGENDCLNSEIHSITIDAQEKVDIAPFQFSTIEVGRTALDAYAIAAVEYSFERECESVDLSGEFNWVVSR